MIFLSRFKPTTYALAALIMLIAPFSVSSEERVVQPLDSKTQKQFVNGLKYELMFRKLSRQVFAEFEQNPSGKMQSDSIALLNRIEAHNTRVMAPVREAFNVDTKIGCGDKVLASTVTTTLKVMPSLGFKYLEGSARRFVSQLEDIAKLSPEKYQDQMEYMVEHERALYRYLVLFNRGRYQAADSIFKQFIKQYQVH